MRRTRCRSRPCPPCVRVALGDADAETVLSALVASGLSIPAFAAREGGLMTNDCISGARASRRPRKRPRRPCSSRCDRKLSLASASSSSYPRAVLFVSTNRSTLGRFRRLVDVLEETRCLEQFRRTKRRIRASASCGEIGAPAPPFPREFIRSHCGAKSRHGTEVSATLYTLVETAAKLLEVDPMR